MSVILWTQCKLSSLKNVLPPHSLRLIRVKFSLLIRIRNDLSVHVYFCGYTNRVHVRTWKNVKKLNIVQCVKTGRLTSWKDLSNWGSFSESIATLPPFGPIEGNSGFSRFPANVSLRRIGLHLSLSAIYSFYLPLHLRSPFHVVPPQW